MFSWLVSITGSKFIVYKSKRYGVGSVNPSDVSIRQKQSKKQVFLGENPYTILLGVLPIIEGKVLFSIN